MIDGRRTIASSGAALSGFEERKKGMIRRGDKDWTPSAVAAPCPDHNGRLHFVFAVLTKCRQGRKKQKTSPVVSGEKGTGFEMAMRSPLTFRFR
jgi:hypothetical protein